MVNVSVPSYIDSQVAPYNHGQCGANADNYYNSARDDSTGTLQYRQFGMFTSEIRKRELKFAEKTYQEEQAKKQEAAASGKKDADEAEAVPVKRARGRKTKSKMLEEQTALDELRRKRKKLITVLH
jgi:hypothetical protein